MPVLGAQRRELPLLAPEATVVDVLTWAVAHARLAPSELNTQPWLFRALVDHRAGTARVELVLDPSRTLPHLDPDRRGAVLACGGALLHLRLALSAAGVGCAVHPAPDPGRPELLAVVDVRGRAAERPDDLPLREAIPARGSRRSPFLPGVPPMVLLDHLVAQAAQEGALATVLAPDDLVRLHEADLAASAHEAHDPGRAQERAAWTRSNLSDAPDGVPGAAHGQSVLPSLAEAHRLRHGESHVSHDELAQEARDRTVLVVGSTGEDPASVLRAGCGVERVLLSGTSGGLAFRFANDSLRYPELRRALAGWSQLDHPQAVLHVGYGAPDPVVTPRRAVADVLQLEGT